MRVHSLLILAFASVNCYWTAASARGADVPAANPATVSYFRDVRPILQVHCQGCHQPAKPMGEYVMTHFAGLVKGGESGEAAIVPGKPDESHLLAMVTPANGKAEMPKDKEPLV